MNLIFVLSCAQPPTTKTHASPHAIIPSQSTSAHFGLQAMTNEDESQKRASKIMIRCPLTLASPSILTSLLYISMHASR